MARLTTDNGSRSIDSTLTDAQAAAACRRIEAGHKDASFARDIANAYSRYGANLTNNRRVWMHILANQQIRREVPAPAPVVPVAPVRAVPAPVVAPVVPPTPAPEVIPADEVAAAADGLALTMLMYDIPESADIANPSGRLRRIGMRLNKSVWIVPTGNVPNHLIAELQQVGSSVITAPYDVTAARGLLAAAIGFANREIAEATKRAEQSAANALAELNSPEGDPNRKRRVYDRTIANIAKRLNALAEEMTVGVNVFGMGRAVNFRALRNAAVTLSTVTTARATAYAAAADTLAAVGTTDAATMAELIRRDEAPAMVVAGMLEDNGHAEQGEALAAAFSDDDTFSLIGMGEDD